MATSTQKITTCLWFDDQAREAAEFYTSLFENSKIGGVTKYGKEGQEFHGKAEGEEMTVAFELENQQFMGLNGGPVFAFNPSVSLFVGAKEQEIDSLWTALSDGGQVLMELDKYDWSEKYGWVQDKYGLSWQIMLDQEGNLQQKICPLLFFTGAMQGKAEAAVNCYTSIFKDSGIEGILYNEEEGSSTNGSVMHSQFKILDQTFMAMDGGPENDHPFNEAISFVVTCNNQEELDYYWDHLSEEGDEKAQQCGWLKDKFGVSWQIIPSVLEEMLNCSNSERSEKVAKALYQMKRLDINTLKEAFG